MADIKLEHVKAMDKYVKSVNEYCVKQIKLTETQIELRKLDIEKASYNKPLNNYKNKKYQTINPK